MNLCGLLASALYLLQMSAVILLTHAVHTLKVLGCV